MKARKSGSSGEDAPAPHRFNGAAPMKARKLSSSRGKAWQSCCFNGAAPMKARKCGGVENPRRPV